MQGLLVMLLMLSGPVSLLIAARFWRGGRLSERAMTNVVVGLVPALVFLYGLIQGDGVPFVVVVTALALMPGAALYRTIYDLVREQRTVD